MPIYTFLIKNAESNFQKKGKKDAFKKRFWGFFFNTNLVFEGAKDQKTYIKKKCLYSLFNVNRWS